jgi:hypothetical protein
MHQSFVQRSVLLFALTLLIAAAGCAVFNRDPHTRAIFTSGDLQVIRPTTPRQGVAAAVKAMDDLQFGIVSKQADHEQGQVKARTPSDRRIVVETHNLGGGATRITIRVGKYGDEQISETIYQKMRRYF